jgi:hypothetical protein
MQMRSESRAFSGIEARGVLPRMPSSPKPENKCRCASCLSFGAPGHDVVLAALEAPPNTRIAFDKEMLHQHFCNGAMPIQPYLVVVGCRIYVKWRTKMHKDTTN